MTTATLDTAYDGITTECAEDWGRVWVLVDPPPGQITPATKT